MNWRKLNGRTLTRKLRTVVIGGMILTPLVALGVARVGYSDWPLARGNAQSTGAANDQLVSEPTLLWELPLGGIGFDGTPVIAGKVVYLGDGDGRVVAISLVDGKLKWKRNSILVLPPRHRSTATCCSSATWMENCMR